MFHSGNVVLQFIFCHTMETQEIKIYVFAHTGFWAEHKVTKSSSSLYSNMYRPYVSKFWFLTGYMVCHRPDFKVSHWSLHTLTEASVLVFFFPHVSRRSPLLRPYSNYFKGRSFVRGLSIWYKRFQDTSLCLTALTTKHYRLAPLNAKALVFQQCSQCFISHPKHT